MASAFGRRWRSNSANRRRPVVVLSRAARRTRRSLRTRRSCPGRGTARSRARRRPSAATWPPTCHGAACTVPSWPCGCAKNSRRAGRESAARHPETRARRSPRTASRRTAASAKLSALRARNSVAVKLPSVFGSAMSMKPPRGQTCSAFASSAWRAVHRRQRQFLVVVVEQLFALARAAPARREARAHGGAGAIRRDRAARAARRSSCRRIARREAQRVAAARSAPTHASLEVQRDVRVARRRLDEQPIERRAADGIESPRRASTVGQQRRLRPERRAPCARASRSAAGARDRITPARSSARMPRAASARLIERPRSAARCAGRAAARTA